MIRVFRSISVFRIPTHLFFFLAFGLSACTSGSKPKSIELMIWGDSSELESVRSFVQGFEKSQPGTTVKVYCINPTDYNQHLQALFLNGQSPDVMYISREWLHFYASKRMIKDLKPFIDGDQQFDFNDFYPEVRNSFFYDDHPFAIAKDFTPLVLYYNQDMFQKAGIPFPNKNWTWDNFLSAARKLTKDVDHDGIPDQYGFVIEYWMSWLMPWIWQNDGAIVDKNETKSLAGVEPYLNSNINSLQFLYDLIYKEHAAPDPKMTDRNGTASLFLNGRAGMCIYGRWVSLDFKKIKDFKWNVAQLPKNKNRSTALLTVGYAISNHTDQPKEAWELIKYLTGIEGQSQVADSGLAVPSRRSIAQSSHFLKAASLPEFIHHEIFLESLEDAQFPPAPTQWPQIEQEFNSTADLIFRQGEPIPNALTQLHKRLESILQTH